MTLKKIFGLGFYFLIFALFTFLLISGLRIYSISELPRFLYILFIVLFFGGSILSGILGFVAVLRDEDSPRAVYHALSAISLFSVMFMFASIFLMVTEIIDHGTPSVKTIIFTVLAFTYFISYTIAGGANNKLRRFKDPSEFGDTERSAVAKRRIALCVTLILLIPLIILFMTIIGGGLRINAQNLIIMIGTTAIAILGIAFLEIDHFLG